MPRKRDNRPMPNGWWLLPGTFVALLAWIAFFMLIGVL
jgi:hypothetical protein